MSEAGSTFVSMHHESRTVGRDWHRWRRGIGLALALLACGAAGAAEAVRLSTAAPPLLSNLLMDSQGNKIATRSAWNRQREELLRQWKEVLGPMPKRKAPLLTEILATEEQPGFTRQHIRYQVEPGVHTDGYLLLPAGRKGRGPAVVVFHPTTPFGARGVAGLEPTYEEAKWHGVHLVQRGYVVWCPGNYINTEGADWAGNAARVKQRHPDWTGMTRMVWDAIRAADFLESLPQVDRNRIGCLGHSLGAKVVLYAMAFDPRYQAGVSSEGGIGLRFSNWDAVWYLGPKIRKADFKLDHHTVLALVAPRAFLLIGGDSADSDQSVTFLDAVRPVYELWGAGDRLQWLNHHQGHRYTAEARARAEAFLDQHLKPR
jgi:hypothetical protein